MQKTFSLDMKKEYLIYGAGGCGLKLINVFKKKGYCLRGFIDKRAASLDTVCGEKVWSLDTLSELREEAENIVIIITIKNVFEHTNIAMELAQIGFDQCIYKPLPILQGYKDKELEKISKAHDIFLISVDIPDNQILSKVRNDNKIRIKDNFIITKQEQEVLTWVPLELLFNYKESDPYKQISMAAFFPLSNLYKLFLGGSMMNERKILDDFFCYCNEWAYRNNITVTKELKQRWIASRHEAFTQMQELVDYDFDFFFRAAPEVERNVDGGFNLICSGRNRVVFLEAKGYRHIPVKMSKDNYKKWINKDVMDEVLRYMTKNHIRKTYAPVPHPYFKTIPSKYVDYYRLVCFPIAKYITQWIFREARINVDKICILDQDKLEKLKQEYLILCDLEDEGACSRYLNMCGFNVVRKRKTDTVVDLFDKLFYQEIHVWQQQKVKLVITDKLNNNVDQCVTKIIFIADDTTLLETDFEFENVLSQFFEFNGMKYINVYMRRGDG